MAWEYDSSALDGGQLHVPADLTQMKEPLVPIV
jgi:hypothetical protein